MATRRGVVHNGSLPVSGFELQWRRETPRYWTQAVQDRATIAERFGCWKHGDFARFVRIAKASQVELLNHFGEALKCRHITKEEHDKLDHAAKKAIKAANGLIRWLENSPDPE